MSHRFTKMAARAGMVAAAAVGVVAITATSAQAAALTFTVTAGTQTTGTVAYSAATPTGTASAPSISFVDVRSNTKLGCISGKAKGNVSLGANRSGTNFANIASTTWNSCTGPLGLVLVPTQVGTWAINATRATTASGLTTGNISNVKATVAASPTASSCSFTVTGSVSISYGNSSGYLSVKSVTSSSHQLVVSGVTGCYGLITNGDTVTFSAAYKVSTTPGKLSITSP